MTTISAELVKTWEKTGAGMMECKALTGAGDLKGCRSAEQKEPSAVKRREEPLKAYRILISIWKLGRWSK
jgi:hypothetical protein